MPRFPFCKLTWRYCLCLRPEDVAPDETDAIHENSAARVEANYRPNSSGNDVQLPDQDDRTTDGNMKENPNYRQELLEAAKLTLAAGRSIASILSFPGSDLVFDVLTGFIEHVQVSVGLPCALCK